jgi:uncharacterized protein YnzC (UPF0291/DUF896 family)
MEEMTERNKRINFLAHKAKTEGLTPEEIKERDVLRKEFIAEFRKNFKSQLDNTFIMDENGNKRPLKKK